MKKKVKFLTFLSKKKNYSNQSLLFFNEYCVDEINKQRLIKKKINFYYQNNVYDNVKKSFAQFKYTNKLYEKILDELSIKLNKINKEKWSKRSWEILIGPWLNRYIAILNDRLNHILEAKKNYNLSIDNIDKKNKKTLISKKMDDFVLNSLNQKWNQTLINRLIQLHKSNSFDTNYLKNYKINFSFTLLHHNLSNKFLVYINNKINFFF